MGSSLRGSSVVSLEIDIRDSLKRFAAGSVCRRDEWIWPKYKCENESMLANAEKFPNM